MRRNNIKYIHDSNQNLLAILIPIECDSSSGISFLTENEIFQQVATMNHNKGYEIQPHYHNQIKRTVDYTCETLVIRKGILKVHLYQNMNEICSFDIHAGDILSLFSGGHGFTVLEDVEMIEIKQGPYIGTADKTRF